MRLFLITQEKVKSNESITMEVSLLSAKQAMDMGMATEKDMSKLCMGISSLKEIVKKYALDDCLELVDSALDALCRVEERYRKHGRYAFDGPGKMALGDAVSLFCDLSPQLTVGDVIGARQRVQAHARRVGQQNRG